MERNRLATPFVQQARTLKVFASKVKTPEDLLTISEIQSALLTAAGFSDKAVGHMDETSKFQAIQEFIDAFLVPAGTEFVEELVFRFLLTRGDSLGGSMRNMAGKLAERKLTQSILSILSLTNTPFSWFDKVSNTWIPGKSSVVGIELTLKAISWERNGAIRTLIYNRTVPLVSKNIDMCLLNSAPEDIKPAAFRIPEKFIAFGELKGGIDPAGADEHWKTAQTALNRIRTAFATKNLSPYLFFVGAVIVDSMSVEIWEQLKDGRLNNAANLTSGNQIASLCNWLVGL